MSCQGGLFHPPFFVLADLSKIHRKICYGHHRKNLVALNANYPEKSSFYANSHVVAPGIIITRTPKVPLH